MQTKVCSKCGHEKPLDAYPFDKRNRDGRWGSCKGCAAAALKAWKSTNAERVKEQAKERAARYRAEKPDLVRARQQRWRDTHPERARDVSRDWWRRNRDSANDRSKEAYRKRAEALTNSYVKHVLLANHWIKNVDVPHSLIEAKRVQLQIKRLIKEKMK